MVTEPKTFSHRKVGTVQHIRNVQAVQWDGTVEHASTVIDAFTESRALLRGYGELYLEVRVMGREMKAVEGDYIVLDDGMLVVMAPEAFEQWYYPCFSQGQAEAAQFDGGYTEGYGDALPEIESLQAQLAEADRMNGELLRRVELHAQTMERERAQHEQSAKDLRDARDRAINDGANQRMRLQEALKARDGFANRVVKTLEDMVSRTSSDRLYEQGLADALERVKGAVRDELFGETS